MISRFFIDRPVLANVLALFFVVIGLVALVNLPTSQYPNVVPPTVQVTTRYPGASASTLVNTVGLPIEQNVNGVENMLYMQSTSASDGTYNLTVTFAIGTSADEDEILVQNRVSAALSSLPAEVQVQGVTTKKQSTSILEFVGLVSPDSRFDSLFLANYAVINVVNELERLNGVGDVSVLGAGQYAMRVWLDPNLMQARGLTPQDVISIIQQQSQEVAAGQIGAPPAVKGQNFQYTLNLNGRINDAPDFENLIVKVEPGAGGRITRIRDVGHVDLGAQTYSEAFDLDGKPAAGIAISLLPEANAVAVSKAVYDKMEELKKSFPDGLEYVVPYDTTKFVKAAISEVWRTLIEAGILVLIVILVFLQDWRAMLVPATTVPVTIIGAFAAMAALGFSINLPTLFAIILVIGIVVDDAIVIVEGVSRHVEEGMPGREAAIKAMEELTGPVIGITLVLMSVFLPAAFLPGLTGQLFRQFALVIAATALISAINAMTLKPTQSALWLRPPKPPAQRNFFYRGFNWVYDRAEHGYVRLMSGMTNHALLMVAVALALVAFAVWSLTRVPTGFLPTEDQGYMIVVTQLPDGASKERTDAVLDKIQKLVQPMPGVEHVVTVSGISILDNRASLANAGVAFVVMKEWDARLKEQGQDQESIQRKINGALQSIPEAFSFAVLPPPIQGVGNVGGFTMQVEIRNGDFDYDLLQSLANTVVADGNAQSGLSRLATTFRAGAPQYSVVVDRTKAEALGITVGQVFSALSGYVGSNYVTQFNKFGHVFQVYTQADADKRATVDDIRNLKVKAGNGTMTPIGTAIEVSQVTGPPLISLYNLYPTATVVGSPAPGFSSGQALDLMEQVGAQALPIGTGFDWTAMSYQEKTVGNTDLLRLRLRDPDGLSRAGRAIRELDPAICGAPCGAAGAARNRRRPQYRGHGQQPLHPDRHHPAHCSRQQERHSDRRICAPAARGGQVDPRRGGRSGAAAVPPDRHDLVRLHPRRAAAGSGDRRGRSGATFARHPRVQRHDRLDLPRGGVRSLVLCGPAVARGTQKAQARAAGRAASSAEQRRSLDGCLTTVAACGRLRRLAPRPLALATAGQARVSLA